MRKKRRSSRLLYIVLLSPLLLASAATMKLMLFPPVELPAIWKEYRVYAFISPHSKEAETPAGNLSAEEYEAVKECFQRHGYHETIHRLNQSVFLFDFEGGGVERLFALNTIFDPADPLYDTYLRRLPNYFEGSVHGRKAELFYVPEKRQSLIEFYRLHRDLDRLGMQYANLREYPKLRMAGIVAFSVILFVLSLLLFRRGLALFLLGAVPLAAGTNQASFLLFSSSLLILTGWAMAVASAKIPLREYLDIRSERSRGGLRMSLLIYMLGLSASFLLLVLSPAKESPEVFLQHAATMVWQIGTAGIFIGIRIFVHRRREHVVFYPEFIKRNGVTVPVGLKVTAGTILVLLAALALFSEKYFISRDLVAPVPLRSGDFRRDNEGNSATARPEFAGFSWEAVSRFEERRRGVDDSQYLPDISDYLSHIAYHQAYFYGRDYRFPQPGEEIRISGYLREGDRIIHDKKLVKMFTDQWYEDIINEAVKQKGVPRLLLLQEGPFRVRTQRVEGLQLTRRTSRAHTVIYLIVALLIFLLPGSTKKREPLSKEISVMRKGRKVA
jgi:hypothetical protein